MIDRRAESGEENIIPIHWQGLKSRRNSCIHKERNVLWELQIAKSRWDETPLENSTDFGSAIFIRNLMHHKNLFGNFCILTLSILEISTLILSHGEMSIDSDSYHLPLWIQVSLFFTSEFYLLRSGSLLFGGGSNRAELLWYILSWKGYSSWRMCFNFIHHCFLIIK